MAGGIPDTNLVFNKKEFPFTLLPSSLARLGSAALEGRIRETYSWVIIISRARDYGSEPDLQQKTMSTTEHPLPMKVEFQ